MKKLTSISIITVAEGKSVSYTYSEVDAAGVIVKSNVRESYLALENDVLSMITNLENKVATKIKE
jgi:hypothetical protein